MALGASLESLRRADGSASFSVNGYSVIAGINGPVEVQRRDELPEEAALEVNIRPAIGLASIRERHFESIVQKALRHIIDVSAFPRTLIQVTLQVTATPEDGHTTSRPPQAASNLSVLPPLLNAAVLALLSTSIPMHTTLASTVVAVLPDGAIVNNPSQHAVVKATSLHVFAFTGNGELLVVESEGAFDMKLWEDVAKVANTSCLGQLQTGTTVGGDDSMQEDFTSVGDLLRQTAEGKIRQDNRWKKATK